MSAADDLDKLRALLRAHDYSHTSYRSWCGVDQLHVYRIDHTSPTQCWLAWTFGDSAMTRAVLAEEDKRAQAGGQRGNARTVTP